MSISGFNKIATDLTVGKTTPVTGVAKKEAPVEVKKEIPVVAKKDTVTTNVSSTGSTLKNFFAKAFSSFSGKVDNNKVETFSSIKNEVLNEITQDRKLGGTLKFALGEKNAFGSISNKKEVSEFKEFAKKEFSTENLDFMKDIKDLVKLGDPNKFKDGFKNLCDKYVKAGSDKEVNLSGASKREMLNALQSGDIKQMAKSLKVGIKDATTNLTDTKARFESQKNEEKELNDGVKSLGNFINKDLKGATDLVIGKKDIFGKVSNQKQVDAFRNLAKKEFSTENLDFLKGVNDLTKIKDRAQFKSEVRDLVNTFVKTGSDREINVGNKERQALVDAANSGNITKITEELQNILKAVASNIGDTKMRFKG